MIKKIFLFIFILSYIGFKAQVSPLISTTWNQGCYYNNLMPTVSSGGSCSKAWTGCNATAMAQILKYYNFPSSGMGSHCNSNNTSHCINFSDQTYNYAVMPNNVSSINTEVEKLMYHIGVAVDMQWNGTNSVSFFSTEVFKRYFKYSPQMYPTASYMFSTTADLVHGLKNELNAGRVVYAKGGNHFYIIDGYNASNQFHCNFGWGGLHNGYYTITNVANAAGNFTPVNFIFNIKPLVGTLDIATATIDIDATATTKALEFTSLSNWSVTTDVTWITLNLNSGNSGYFNDTDDSNFTAAINNGDARTGHITITNGFETKIITVNQAASPLGVSSLQFDYLYTESTQQLNTTWYSWANWTATTSDSWITLLPNSGTGNATINITCSENNSPTTRSGHVYVNGGAFTREILINQLGNTLGTENYEFSKFTIYPNPTSDLIQIETPDEIIIKNVSIFDINGRLISRNIQIQNDRISLKTLKSGTYLIEFDTGKGKTIKKIVKF